jgi:hypothetical protein
MVVRLLTHPLAEDVFVFVSLGLILLSVGLVGSLLWSLPSDDDLSPSSQASIATASAAPAAAPNNLAVACVKYSGFVWRTTLSDCAQ